MDESLKNKSKSDLIHEVEILRIEKRALKSNKFTNGFVSVVNNLIRYGCILGVTYFFYLGVLALAGKYTFANIGIGILSDLKISDSLAWLFGGSGVIYGLRERSVRKKTVQHLSAQKANLEQLIDPQRTSSLLTERGETNPEDEL